MSERVSSFGVGSARDFLAAAFPRLREGIIDVRLDNFRDWADLVGSATRDLGREAVRAAIASAPVPAVVGDFMRLCTDLDRSLQVRAAVDGLLAKSGTLVLVGADVLQGDHDASMRPFLESPSWRNHVFEPSPLAIDALRANCRAFPRCSVHQMAVTNVSGTMKFYVCAEKSSLSTTKAAIRDHRSKAYSFEEITVASVDFENLLTIVGEDDFDVLFVDAEGSEFEIISDCLLRARPRLIFFEWIHLCRPAGAAGGDRHGGLQITSLGRALLDSGYRLNLVDDCNAMAFLDR